MCRRRLSFPAWPIPASPVPRVSGALFAIATTVLRTIIFHRACRLAHGSRARRLRLSVAAPYRPLAIRRWGTFLRFPPSLTRMFRGIALTPCLSVGPCVGGGGLPLEPFRSSFLFLFFPFLLLTLLVFLLLVFSIALRRVDIHVFLGSFSILLSVFFLGATRPPPNDLFESLS